jgi:TM2 domain-containing membrane protein YozV
MRYLLALFLPWLTFFTMGKIFQGILCLILQFTIIGWLPASIWAMVSVAGYHADKRTDRIVNAMAQAQQQPPAADPRRI